MKTGRQIQMTKKIIGLNGRLNLKIGIIVAAVAGCLLAVPLTRTHNHSAVNRGRVHILYLSIVYSAEIGRSVPVDQASNNTEKEHVT